MKIIIKKDKMSKIAQKEFEKLLGEKIVNYIEHNNWVKFSKEAYNINGNNKIEISFREKDGKGDTVIFHIITYKIEDKKWVSENCIDYPYIEFDTFEKMVDHIRSIEIEIVENGGTTIGLPDFDVEPILSEPIVKKVVYVDPNNFEETNQEFDVFHYELVEDVKVNIQELYKDAVKVTDILSDKTGKQLIVGIIKNRTEDEKIAKKYKITIEEVVG